MALTYASISQTGSGNLVAGVSGQKFTVLTMLIVPASSVTMQIKSNTTALTGAIPIGGAGNPTSLELRPAQFGHFQTLAAGDPLVLTLGTSVAVTGYLVYDTSPSP
jgi:hypothetical protein